MLGRFLTWHLLLISLVVLTAGATVAIGQAGPAIPSHRVDRNSTGSTCDVSILPDMRSSDTAPFLVIRSRGAASPGSFSIDVDAAQPVVDIQFVARNVREKFAPIRESDAASIARGAFWKTLVTVHKSGAPFHLTARLEDGSWASSRYDMVDPLGIIRLLEQSCGFRSNALSARSTADLIAEEKSLSLRAGDIEHIRWVLLNKYDPKADQPAESMIFSLTDRIYIERYAISVGQPGTKYLTRALATQLLSEPFRPSPHDYGMMRSVKYHGDWVNYINPTDSRCYMETASYSWTVGRFYRAPRMMFSAERLSAGNFMYFSMVTPNPFVGSAPVTAVVDGRRYRLDVERDQWVKPPVEGTGLSNAVVKAIARGSMVQITGTERKSRAPLSLSFSALGFTASFNQLMSDCGKPRLKDWLR